MFPQIINMEVENGRAVVELALPDWPGEVQGGYFEVYLWENGVLTAGQSVDRLSMGRQLAFYGACPMDEDDTCVMHLVNPHLWEGIEKPYLYRLEVYAVVCNAVETSSDGQCSRELIFNHPMAIRSLKEIPEKGYFLNGRTFNPRCVYYDGICDIYDKGSHIFWEGLMQRLQILALMGANTLVLGSGKGMSEQEHSILQEYCDRVGLLLGVEDCNITADIRGVKSLSGICNKTDTCVMGGELFDTFGLPKDAYYCCKAKWSKVPMVYISARSICKQPDGAYKLAVYTNCRKVVLMVNGRVFGIQEGSTELFFQDIQIKGFPVDITAQAGECSMTIRSYGTSWKV